MTPNIVLLCYNGQTAKKVQKGIVVAPLRYHNGKNGLSWRAANLAPGDADVRAVSQLFPGCARIRSTDIAPAGTKARSVERDGFDDGEHRGAGAEGKALHGVPCEPGD
jgi:hypothetical protein